jgi:SulP family sulfate permease
VIGVPAKTRIFGYSASRLSSDLVAGITLAAYAIPVSLAYATLAGLPPQVGVYGYLMGGLGYALAGSSRFLAIGPYLSNLADDRRHRRRHGR